jgi:hypothetical protein
VVARGEVVDVVAVRLLLQLDLPAVHRPETVLLLLLPGGRVVAHRLLVRNVGVLLLRELVHLLARLRQHDLGDGAVVVEEDLVEAAEEALVRPGPLLVVVRPHQSQQAEGGGRRHLVLVVGVCSKKYLQGASFVTVAVHSSGYTCV